MNGTEDHDEDEDRDALLIRLARDYSTATCAPPDVELLSEWRALPLPSLRALADKFRRMIERACWSKIHHESPDLAQSTLALFRHGDSLQAVLDRIREGESTETLEQRVRLDILEDAARFCFRKVAAERVARNN